MNSSSQEPSMDPSPDSQSPSAAPGVPDEPASKPIEAEVVDEVPPDVETEDEVVIYDGQAMDPAASPAVPDTRPGTVGVATQATVDSSIMTREQYRALADRLILDKAAWFEFYDRCRCFASVRMYGHKSPATVAAAGLKGMSLGMSFMEAIDRIKVIHGTPVIRGPAAINHIHERCAGAKCRCIESTDKKAVWRMERPGWDPKEFTYTWEQAEHAGLPGKNPNYKKYPARCLKWQAASEGAQEMFGDVLSGLYFQEELETEERQDSSDGSDAGGKTSYEAPTGTATSTGAGGGASSTERVEPTGEHPKVARVKELMLQLAQKRGATGDNLPAMEKGIYNETLHVLKIKVEKGKFPTLPQLDKMIAHLEAACSG